MHDITLTMQLELYTFSGNHTVEIATPDGKTLSYKFSVPKHELVFAEMVKELASLALYGTGVEIVLQRDLNTLIKAGELANEPRDISWLKEQIKANIFDPLNNGRSVASGLIAVDC